jgi:hypothetical protein
MAMGVETARNAVKESRLSHRAPPGSSLPHPTRSPLFARVTVIPTLFLSRSSPATPSRPLSSCVLAASGLFVKPPRARCGARCVSSPSLSSRPTPMPPLFLSAAHSWTRWSGRGSSSSRRRLLTFVASGSSVRVRWARRRWRSGGTARCARGGVRWLLLSSPAGIGRGRWRGWRGRRSRGRRRARSWRSSRCASPGHRRSWFWPGGSG